MKNNQIVSSSHCVIAAGHPLAAAAGVSVKENGGSLVDAAIAASAVLSVVLPHANSIGGDVLGLIYDASSQTIYGLDASGTAPASVAALDAVPRIGARSAVIPGLVGGWASLHQRFGRQPWHDLLKPAIKLAADGFSAPHSMIEFIHERRHQLQEDAGCTQLFLNPSIRAGSLYRQPALAKTLTCIAENGADIFYSGEIGQAIARFMANQNGLICHDDLKHFKPRWANPLMDDYRGHSIAVLPPTSFGLLLPLQLAGLSTYDSAYLAQGGRNRLDAELCAMGTAFEQAESWVCDANSHIDSAVLHQLAGLVRSKVQLSKAQTPADGFGGTSCVLLSDTQGNIVILVQSIFQPFGAACADPQTGILFNNRMAGFDPAGPNAIAANKHPAHTLSPALLFDHGVPRWGLATPGGLSQTATLAQVISNLIDRKMDIASAVEAPRWCLSRTRQVLLEPDYPYQEADYLQGKNAVVMDDPYSFGSVKIVEYHQGRVFSYADTRRNAHALGLADNYVL